MSWLWRWRMRWVRRGGREVRQYRAWQAAQKQMRSDVFAWAELTLTRDQIAELGRIYEGDAHESEKAAVRRLIGETERP